MPMISKSNSLLLLLFALTVCVVGWLGFQLASQQDQQIKMRQIAQSEQALQLMQNNINEYIKSHQNQLAELLDADIETMQLRLNTDPLIHDILMFDAVDALVFPQQISQAQQKSSYQWLHNIANQDEAVAVGNLDSGWFVWYDQQNEKYIYWISNPSRKLFIELNNAMFMADFIYWLANQPNIASQAFLIINDNQGRVFYQWSDNSIEEADINIQKNLNSPLTGWSLRYFSNSQSWSTLSKSLFQIVVVSLLVLLSIITYILYKIKHREQLEALQRISFVNQVSHELKTPLTNIRLHGDLLKRTLKAEHLETKSGQSIDIIQQESERLTRLINNILNFNSVDNNSLKVDCRSIEFESLLDQSIQPFKPSFEQLNIEILIQNSIHSQVRVDTDLVKQIIANLLSNVEKYATNSEQVKISTEQNSDFIKITIQDQGSGIHKKYQSKVFDPFYRIHSDLTHATGSGLGLGLARELARLHGGDLVLLQGKTGACFQVTIRENHA